MAVDRFYARTRSSIDEILPYASLGKEIQIVLAFARDYDNEGNYQTGKFFPYFDTITPQDILNIKNCAAPASVKFFLSIGGRDPRFPFAVTSADECTAWIENATESLGRIVQEYHFDGIDVYYEHINPEACPYFPDSIVPVIGYLKAGKNPIITQASITVSPPLIDIYLKLYDRCAQLIDNVVYQCFTVPEPIHTPQDLAAAFRDRLYRCCPAEKILAGYSDWPCEQTCFSPATFVAVVAWLLPEGLLGISMWHGNPAP